MSRAPRLAEPRLVLAAIAGCMAPAPDESRLVGDVALHAHQREAVARCRAALETYGGALLADETGLGKTWVALALAEGIAPLVIVAPAALRPMWHDALARAGRGGLDDIELLSYEQLSRGVSRPKRPALVVADEAHHARTPGTRRWHRLADLCAGTRVLLLTATPIHNRRADLDALLSLFLGARAAELPDAELARVVVRRGREVLGDAPTAGVALPAVRRTVVLDPPHDAGTLDAILALPAPVPPAGGGDGGVLLAWSLVRQWASSAAALRAALGRRLARAAALESALEAGRHPTAAELRAWVAGDDAVQLAFPELLASAGGTAELLAAVRAHAVAVRALRAAIPAHADDARVALLRGVRAAHPGERIVAFASFAETVEVLAHGLAADGGVAALTARGAEVAGGRLSRREALVRFAPRAHGAAEPPRAGRIDLLLATDLLSEGVNLQDATVVVHLDMPWTPARLEQRVGRAARIGSAAREVAVYAMAPPASAEAILGVERRLRAKAAATRDAVGLVGTILPSLLAAPPAASPLSGAERLHAELARCRALGPEEPLVRLAERGIARPAAVLHCGMEGLVACCVAAGDALADPSVFLVGGALDALGEEPGPIATLLAAAREALERGDAATPMRGDASALAAARSALRRWLDRREVEGDVGLDRVRLLRARRAVAQRIAAAVRHAPLHRRRAVAALARRAAPLAARVVGAGVEDMLHALALDAGMPDESFLRAVAEFARMHEWTEGPPRPRPVALLVLRR